MNPKVILIAAGGTGGHVIPALSISKELVSKGFHPVLIGKGSELEKMIGEGYESKNITAIPPSSNPLKLPEYLLTVRKGIVQANKLIEELKPVAVLGMGNYTSVPLVLAAKNHKIPILLHEQNAIGGRANRLLSRYADVVLAGFEGTIGFPKDKIEVVGNPLRWVEIEPFEKKAFEVLGLDPSKKVVLFFGGSQGAQFLNQAFIALPKELLSKDNIQWLIISGTKTHEETKKRIGSLDLKNIVLLEYLATMEMAYSVASVAVTRAGAMTVSELECTGIPAILIPRTTSVNNHQLFNAKYLATKQDCVILKENEAHDKLKKSIILLLDRKRQPISCLHIKSALHIAEIIEAML